MVAPFTTKAARHPEETYQLAHLSRTKRPSVSSMDHNGHVDSTLSSQRIPGEEFGDDDIDAFIAENEGSQHGTQAHPRLRLVASFFLFGVLNNILYVIILSAALDLVPASTPKGLVAFFNIFPSLTTKLLWPYLSSGTVRYQRRMLVCTAASWTGMIVIATFNATALRLLGIGIASFSSGLGELSFLQLSTTLPTPSMSRDALGAWASGTGGAGIGGAALWWFLRSLGVSTGLGIASFLPFAFPAVFFLLLPRVHRTDGHNIIDDGYTTPGTHGSSGFQPIFVAEDEDVSVQEDDHHSRKVALTIPLGEVVLTTREKIALAKPMVLRYMVPLFLVYAFEYIINAGVMPALAFPPPRIGIWTHVFKSIRDFYPFWSLTYQTFVFLSRSSLSLGIRPLPRRLLFLPALLQGIILTLLSLQASHYIFSSPDTRPHRTASDGNTSESWWNWTTSWLHGSATASTGTDIPDRAISVVFLLICLEGIMGGLGYTMTFFHISHDDEQNAPPEEYSRIAQVDETDTVGGMLSSEMLARRKAIKEFRMAAAGAADSLGIVLATLIAMPVEVSLCNAQVKAGSNICKEL